MIRSTFDQLRRIVQVDRNRRGLQSNAGPSIFDRFDLEAACESLVAKRNGGVAIVTGFFVPHAQPPRPETDGPLGAIKIAEICHSLGMRVMLLSDEWCREALERGCELARLESVPIVTASRSDDPLSIDNQLRILQTKLTSESVSHLIAIERPGPSYRAQSHPTADEGWSGRCFNMSGEDITEYHFPFHRLFLAGSAATKWKTIGIGDGGNEIGMGCLNRHVLCQSIPLGDRVACRIATDYLLTAGVSNWGGYALAAGLAIMGRLLAATGFFDPAVESRRLEALTRSGLLVDGITGKASATVDKLPAAVHAELIAAIRDVVASAASGESGV